MSLDIFMVPYDHKVLSILYHIGKYRVSIVTGQ